MTIADVFSAVNTHATAAAAAIGTGWDVAIAPPLPRGKTVRIFYGGERETPHFGLGRTMNSQLVSQAIMVRAFWPVADYAKLRRKNLMLEMAAFAKEMRTRILGDSQLGGTAVDLVSSLADPDDILFGQTHYAILDIEYTVEFDETTMTA